MDEGVWDADFDIRSDRPPGKDPDRYSATLRAQHRLMWTKPLPTGPVFELVDTFPRGYLRFRGRDQEHSLGSDMSIRTFHRVHRMKQVVATVSSSDLEEFQRRGCTIAGTMLFPARQVEGRHTINQARGLSRQVEDRLDLTVECIRRHYRGEASPLDDVLARYASFFALFGDFAGYAHFWLLDDLVDADGTVRFFTDWSDFSSSRALPTAGEYERYRVATLAFVERRRARMQAHLDALHRLA